MLSVTRTQPGMAFLLLTVLSNKRLRLLGFFSLTNREIELSAGVVKVGKSIYIGSKLAGATFYATTVLLFIA
jgi:hypothetical protein